MATTQMHFDSPDIMRIASPQRLEALDRVLSTLQLAPELHAQEIEALETAIEAMQGIDEADRALGQALRRNEALANRQSTMDTWLALAKEQAGYGRNVPFDVVWTETLQRAGVREGGSTVIGAVPVTPGETEF